MDEPGFYGVFCANAWRAWAPIWCLEAKLVCDAGAMDMSAWLGEHMGGRRRSG